VTDLLTRIKRAVLSGRYVFSEKALVEMEADGITELDVVESIANAVAIYKTLRSDRPRPEGARQYLHVIQSTNLSGLPIYTKGRLVREEDADVYYFLISAKRALR
jgi:hypothetical protein